MQQLLSIGEEDELEEEKQKLQNFNRLFERLNTAYVSISGDTHALDWVGSAMSDMEDAASVDKELNHMLKRLQQVSILCKILLMNLKVYLMIWNLILRD